MQHKQKTEAVASAPKTPAGMHQQGEDGEVTYSREVLEKITYDLRERVKELNCLYSISSIVEKGLSLDETLQDTVDLIPDAWQYPDITCSRLLLKEKVFSTDNFAETPWKQSQPVFFHGVQIGLLEIYYLECMPDKDEGPFLAEERRLINAIAERIGGIIERKRSQAALEESESRNRALLNAIPDLMFQINGEGKLLRFHEGKLTDLRPFLSEWVGKNVYVLADDKRLLPKRIIEQLRMYVRRAFTTGKTQVFEQHVMICGTKSDFEIRIVASSPDEVLGIVRDITLRKRLEREILEISGREQRRIGHDLHDSLCQHLAGVAFMAKVLERNLAAGLAVESSRAGEIVDLIDQAITLTRSLARGLNPVRLEAGGLMTALTELASNTEKFFAIKCRFSSKEPIVIDDNATASHLYRIAQEAISNSIKHGKADSISIIFETDGKTSTLTIKDNGSGSVSSISQGKGMGLNIMNYRASMIGATLDIKNDTDKGIVVICSFPNKKTD